MGIIFNRKPCSNCGSTTFHRECFSGGSRSSLAVDSKTYDNYLRQVEHNLILGKKALDGIPKEHKDLMRNYASSDACKSAVKRGRKS